MSEFAPQKYVACDTETTGLLHWCGDVPFAVGMCDENGQTIYFEWPVDPFTRECAPYPEDVAFLKRYLEDPAYEKVFHNARFDIRMLELIGINVQGVVHDTAIAGRICDNTELDYKLKRLAKVYIGIPDDDEKELKDLTRACRKKAQAYNRACDDDDVILLSGDKDIEADYWLCRFYYPNDRKCELYCSLDTARTMALFHMYSSVMGNDPLLKQGYEVEMYDVWPVVCKMEKRGVRINPEMIDKEHEVAKNAVAHFHELMVAEIIEKDLRPFKDNRDPHEFNPESPVQVGRILYLPKGEGGLGLTTERKNKTGQSSDKYALRDLLGEEFVRNLTQWRSAQQAISLFFEKYKMLMRPSPPTGEMTLHPGYNQCGAVTFRFSCSNPNLQQVGDPESAHVDIVAPFRPRAPFGPRQGYTWYAGDYAQQELRIFASVSDNQFLLGEIKSGRDPNAAVANRAWGGPDNEKGVYAAAKAIDLHLEEPSSDLVAAIWKEYDWDPRCTEGHGIDHHLAQEVAYNWLSTFKYDIVKAEKSVGRSNSRSRAKSIFFLTIYGGGAKRLALVIGTSLREAQEFLGDFNRAMPEIRFYSDNVIAQVRTNGFIVNPYGRKLRIDRDFAYRGVNHMIQSTAACMMKDALVKCDRYFLSTGLDAHVLMTIHDEAVFEVYNDHVTDDLLRGIMHHMSDTGDYLKVPMPVELVRLAHSWDQKEPVEL